MRRLKRNQRAFTYYLYTGQTEEVDSDGYKTGRHTETYADGVSAKGCITYKGTSSVKPFGVDEDFKVQIIPDSPIENITTQTKIVIDGNTYYVTSHPTTMNEQRIFAS